jgi:molecular chaperone DnaK
MKRSELELLTQDLVERTIEPCKRHPRRRQAQACRHHQHGRARRRHDAHALGAEAVKEFFGRSPTRASTPTRWSPSARPSRAPRSPARSTRCSSSTSPPSRSASRRAAASSPSSSRATPRSPRSAARSSPPASTTRASCRSTCSRASARWPPTTAASPASSSRASRRRRAASPRSRSPSASTPTASSASRPRTSAPTAARPSRSPRRAASTKDEVERLIAEAERFQETDGLRRELAELRNQAETLLYTTEQALDGYADLVDADILTAVKKDADLLRKLVESGADINSIREAYASLETAAYRIAESMYGESS